MEQQQRWSTWENAIMRIALRFANCPGNLLKGNIQMHFNISKISLQQIQQAKPSNVSTGGEKNPNISDQGFLIHTQQNMTLHGGEHHFYLLGSPASHQGLQRSRVQLHFILL